MESLLKNKKADFSRFKCQQTLQFSEKCNFEKQEPEVAGFLLESILDSEGFQNENFENGDKMGPRWVILIYT